MHAIVHAADIQDRDGGVLLMATLFGAYPFLLKLYANGGYAGPQFQTGLARVMRQVSIEVVKRSDGADDCLAEPVPQAGQGLGMPEPTRTRLPAPGIYPPHAAKAMPGNGMIPDRHL